jgi:L-alanine-DL-glutamate epimerase-like enolase superfamily enzyme
MDNIGKNRLEWLVRARTEGGLEGLTIANKFMRDFSDFHATQGTVAGLLDLLREVFLGRRTDEFLEVSGGRVTDVTPSAQRSFGRNGWMSILAFDLLGQEMGVSCVDLLGGGKRDRVDAYDTTLYFQDLIQPDKGAAQVAREARDGYDAGYRQMKIKVGRGGRWMLPEDGMRRDAEVVLAVRESVGPESKIMVDANFGYDGHLDLLEEFVRQTLPANVFWFEEMVTADVGDYRAFRDIQSRAGSDALLVCGEVDRDPVSEVFRDLITEGLIDGYQPDIVAHGFSGWQEIESFLASTAVRSIPHNFGNGNFGTRADLMFGSASETFLTVEDERHLPNVYADDGFVFGDGSYTIPSDPGPGLGLAIDEDEFQRSHAVHENTITA